MLIQLIHAFKITVQSPFSTLRFLKSFPLKISIWNLCLSVVSKSTLHRLPPLREQLHCLPPLREQLLATSNSIEHMSCFNDAAGRLQECALDAATRGNRYINSSLRLNEEMKGIENLAGQLKILRRNVDALDTAVNRLTRFP
ncbi:uncharacterized protein LOC116001908 isoform X2 [Ipomoea triloba]|uniref:uncharacterized protein LOC116001908 isoform X2 n=1 Tax=Ipomoea triloba TaxID=35885 RepID=UPI00125CDE21|nr:uncharacterized protein LOC116001908 isoform X2 [Ipomoea triloba]